MGFRSNSEVAPKVEARIKAREETKAVAEPDVPIAEIEVNTTNDNTKDHTMKIKSPKMIKIAACFITWVQGKIT